MSDEKERPEDTVRRFAKQLVAIEELHAVRSRASDGFTFQWCRECQQDWPCPTLRAMEL